MGGPTNTNEILDKAKGINPGYICCYSFENSFIVVPVLHCTEDQYRHEYNLPKTVICHFDLFVCL